MKKRSKSGLSFCAMVAILFCFANVFVFSGCSHGSSDDDGVSNPFAGTEWSGSDNSLIFYSNYTVGGNSASMQGAFYRVESRGTSYVATIYIDVGGYKQDLSTLTISSKDAASGDYTLVGTGMSVTLQKVGGTDSSEGGNGGGNSSGKGTKGGSSGDRFMNTIWSNSDYEIYLQFSNYGDVEYGVDEDFFRYEYYFEVTEGYYLAKAYEYGTDFLMFTFKFSIASPRNGTLVVGNKSYQVQRKLDY